MADVTPAAAMYFGVPVVGLIGAAVARLRPNGMARALFATALAQALGPGGRTDSILTRNPQVTSWTPPELRGFGGNAFFGLLFAGSALLFRKAGRGESANRRGLSGRCRLQSRLPSRLVSTKFNSYSSLRLRLETRPFHPFGGYLAVTIQRLSSQCAEFGLSSRCEPKWNKSRLIMEAKRFRWRGADERARTADGLCARHVGDGVWLWVSLAQRLVSANQSPHMPTRPRLGRLALSRLLLNASFQCAVFGLSSHGERNGTNQRLIRTSVGDVPACGMRIRVKDVLDMLAGGASAEEILSDFPDPPPEDIRACIAYAARY